MRGVLHLTGSVPDRASGPGSRVLQRRRGVVCRRGRSIGELSIRAGDLNRSFPIAFVELTRAVSGETDDSKFDECEHGLVLLRSDLARTVLASPGSKKSTEACSRHSA